MNMPRRPIDMLAIVGGKLSRLPRRVVFIGGATTGLYITDRAALEPRATDDVDVVVQVDRPPSTRSTSTESCARSERVKMLPRTLRSVAG
jgi:hypothetical protein